MRRPQQPLRCREAFLANPKIVSPIGTSEDAEHILTAYLGAYCAGMRSRATAWEVLEGLRCGPDCTSETSETIRWLLGSIRVREAVRLVACCGVPIATLAEHVRACKIKRADLIVWLNQFAVPK